MMITGEIDWSGNVGAPGAGTVYNGRYDGEVLFVIHSVGDGRARRFRAFRVTSAGERHREHPVGRGGELAKVRYAKDECARELDSMTEAERETLIGNLRERRELLTTLRHLKADREAHRMSLPELREAVSALVKPAQPDDLARLPRHEQVDEYDDGVTAWRVGDRVQFPGPVFEPGDVWRITALYVPIDKPAYAGVRLVDRRSGLPRGQTGTALSLRHLTRIAVTGHASAPAAEALRKLRDDHLPMWLRTCMENDAGRQLSDRETDPEAYPLHADDVRTMIADVARELGIAL